ncbi:Uma2 family endonuclease [Prochlorothrix hollandica]|uniref:Uma2 family endonuclease n=1 Tax=Prochlorothrix hollandica TaxID=1223 RepID=UPI000344E633|nr:Uma2 family endonuclease [Prochlorothrix hollandica]
MATTLTAEQLDALARGHFIATTPVLTLQQFLAQPTIEDSPAWEFMGGQALQKPMPSLFHSRLQRNLVNRLNQSALGWEAIQELRCVLPEFSPVPDIVVVRIDRLGNEDSPLEGAPDWLIEIRSLGQGTLELQRKILACLQQGTALAWLIDWHQQQVWVWEGDSLPKAYEGGEVLPVLPGFPSLTVDQVLAFTQAKL